MTGSASLRTPPIPAPPHDPTWIRLDARVGWRAAAEPRGLEPAADGGLRLAVLPDRRRTPGEPGGGLGGLVPPPSVALAGDGGLYLLDTADARLTLFDPCDCAFRTPACFDDRDDGPRSLDDPRAIAIRGRTLYLCDAGPASSPDDPDAGGRVTVWALPDLALRAVWTLPPAPPDRPNPWRPVAVAATRSGRIWVADRANGAVHRFDRTGRLRRSIGGFGGVRQLAVDRRGRVYIVLDGADDARVLDPDGRPLGTVRDPDRIRPRFAPLPFAVDREGRLDLRALCEEGSDASGFFDRTGEPIPVPESDAALFEAAGELLAGPLDSGLRRCQWHRLVIRGRVPTGARLRVETYTAETPRSSAQIDALPEDAWATRLAVVPDAQGEWDGLVRSEPGRYMWLRLRYAADGRATPVVRSVRVEFPRISLRRYLPGVWGEEAVARDLTDRFLSVFDTIFRGVEHRLDTQAGLFDPDSSPAERPAGGDPDFLSWLASWIGVSFDRRWPEALRRRYLKEAARLFHLRGTREGLRRQLVLFLRMDPEAVGCRREPPRTRCGPRPTRCGRPEEPERPGWRPPPLILEHFRLRRWLFLGAGRLGDQAVLWGQRIVNRSRLVEDGEERDGAQAGGTQLITTPDPLRDPFHVHAHRFSVFVPAACRRDPGRRGALASLVEEAKPAHTDAQIVFVEPRFRVGVQSMIGLDSVVGRYPEGMELETARLGDESVLAGDAASAGAPARIGRDARLD